MLGREEKNSDLDDHLMVDHFLLDSIQCGN